ncbi:hypothetical protein F3F96_08070 [Mariprofundus sp. NF]|uniref:hypothetical protein n=1 Tax=Mariprofundus sp. NF TaxID=2608716 RepID=UPI0015A4425E|nr:hypothetical protein [Mariprofundus sp. NF]NWF39087.1 hypothetical protein [Mariprofundus sp. NF]
MCDRCDSDIGFIKQVPAEQGNRSAVLEMTPMTLSHANWWQKNIQVHIKDDKTRADHGWKWPTIFTFNKNIGSFRGQLCEGWVINLVASEDKLLPVGMVLIAKRYVSLGDLPNHSRKASFLWYLNRYRIARHLRA